MIDAAVQGDMRAKDKGFEKIETYHLLNDKVWRLWNAKNIVHPKNKFYIFHK